MADELVEILCDEAEDLRIRLIVEDRKGGIDLSKGVININPVYWDERHTTFIHEMVHYHLNEIEGVKLDRMFEEKYCEDTANDLLYDNDNNQYVTKYLSRRL